MALIDVNNFAASLVQSSQPRSGTPDGNIYFDTTNRVIEVISSDELAMVDLGAGLVANPLSEVDGITAQALYGFTTQERRADDTLRHWLPWAAGVFEAAGAYELRQGWVLGNTGLVSDWAKIRGSGLVVRAADGSVSRVYFGARSLNNIDPTSQPYYQLAASTSEADLQAAVPVDFSRPGAVDEMIQVFGSTAGGDLGAGDFDDRTSVLVLSVRTWQNNFGRTNSIATGIPELGGFGAGFGLGESPNAANIYALADVWTTPVAPFDGLSLEVVTPAQTRTGFSGGSADFDIIVSNTGGATLQQVRAWLDAVAIHDTDSDSGAGSLLGKRANQLYSIDTQGRVITTEGLFIEGLLAADQQSVVMTDITGTGQTYPFNVQVEVEVGALAVADPLAWYEVFFVDGAGADDYETANAVTVEDASGTPVRGFVSADAVGTKIVFSYAYDSNTQAGLPAGVEKDMIVLVEGDGGVTQASAVFTVTRQTVVAATAAPTAELNL